MFCKRSWRHQPLPLSVFRGCRDGNAPQVSQDSADRLPESHSPAPGRFQASCPRADLSRPRQPHWRPSCDATARRQHRPWEARAQGICGEMLPLHASPQASKHPRKAAPGALAPFPPVVPDAILARSRGARPCSKVVAGWKRMRVDVLTPREGRRPAARDLADTASWHTHTHTPTISNTTETFHALVM